MRRRYHPWLNPFRVFASLAALPTALALWPGTASAQLAGAIRGSVVDSLARRALVRATVIATRVGGTADTAFHSALTDEAGRFVIAALSPGRYALIVDHPSIDASGIDVLPSEADVVAGTEVTVALATPSAARLRRALCPAAARDTTLGVVLGTVRGTDKAQLPGATVVFTWSDFDLNRSTGVAVPRQLATSVIADSLGVYRACGLPVGITLLVQAQTDARRQSGIVEERMTAVGVRILDFQVPAAVPVTASDTSAALGSFALSGRVETTTAAPVASAQVRLFGTSHFTTTREDGQFRLSGLPGGTQAIEVMALGYYPQRIRLELGDDNAPAIVKLERTATVLDSIRVIARRMRGVANGGRNEYEERLLRGRGMFIREEDIERRHPFVTTDLLKTLPGLVASTARSSADEVILSTRSSGFGGRCALQVFVDGIEVQPTDVNTIAPASIHGIEVVGVSGAPPQYHVRNCGAMLIWTK